MDTFMDKAGQVFLAIANGISEAVDIMPPELLGFIVLGLLVFAFIKSR